MNQQSNKADINHRRPEPPEALFDRTIFSGYSHTRIYVGQTEDLSTRFDNHHKEACFDKHNKNCVCVHGEEDEDTRLEIEKDLIDKYDPPCNAD
jgi:predicted site-specific integrase-resolvase